MGKVIGLAGVLALVSGLAYVGLTGAYRLDMMSFGDVFGYLQPLTMVLLGTGALAVLLALFGIFTGKAGAGFFALIGAVAALGSAYGPVTMKMQADKVPAIHDISTDVKYPPLFVDVRKIRLAEESPNSVEFNADLTEKQLEAYPDLKTVTFNQPAEEVFYAAVAVLEEMGLEIVGKDFNAGRIEATDTTFWWGFKDDVVIRVNRFTSPVEVDVRSKSRVGQSDLGVNAERIRTFLKKLDAKVGN